MNDIIQLSDLLDFRRIVDNFEGEFSLHDRRVLVGQKYTHTKFNIDLVAGYFFEENDRTVKVNSNVK